MRSMIQSQVQRAFNLIGDLAEVIILSSSSSSKFDYTTGLAVISKPVTYNLRAVTTMKRRKDTNVILVEIIVMAKDIETITDLDAFDKVTVRGIEYHVITPSLNDGYTVTINATKEAI